MGDKTHISWTDATWSPIRGCTKVSPGCDRCYAMSIAYRFSGVGQPYEGLARKVNGRPAWTNTVRFVEEHLLLPLRWRAPRHIFVCSQSDLFHAAVTDDQIIRIFAVMAMASQHTFQILTKRPARMAALLSDPLFPFRVAEALDALVVTDAMRRTREEVRPLADYPGYRVSNAGVIYSRQGSTVCVFCGKPVEGIASKKYCDRFCKQNACFYRRTGRDQPLPATYSALVPDEGDKGHQRVTLYIGGERRRELVHHLVLKTFDRPAGAGEEGCHRDGNPRNNHIANLRWGSQSDNWDDRRRQGRYQSYAKLTHVQVATIRQRLTAGETPSTIAREFPVTEQAIRMIQTGRNWAVDLPIEWPIPWIWLGTSCENQATADERIPHLLATPAALRWLSCEPLLGPLNLDSWLWEVRHHYDAETGEEYSDPEPSGALDWIVCGGESGPGYRPLDLAWARSLQQQCEMAEVPLWFKQDSGPRAGMRPDALGQIHQQFPEVPA